MSQFQTENKTPESVISTEEPVRIEHETPMPSGQFVAYQLRASVLIFLFYIYCAIAIIVGALTGLACAIAALRIPYSWGVAVVIGSILKIFCLSLRIGRGADFNIKLKREEAPEFFHDVELLSQKLAVAPPREIVIESGPNAYVRLSGLFTGAGKTTLGFGYDFLAGLDKNQARAVLAHEMAHAKHVKRGYQGFLMRGVVRLSNCEGALQAIASYPENSGLAKGTAKTFVFIPKLLVERATKLIAACSRYDEFLADRVAAQLTGPQMMKDALLATHVIDHQGAKLSWRERLLHLDRAPGYTAWLEKQFYVPDDEKRLEIEGRAIERAERSEFSTHPALPDRLKALDDFQGTPDLAFENDESIAATWLKNPDVTAKRLLGEVESVAAKQEAKATKELAKEAKKLGKHRAEKAPVSRGVGIGLGLVGLCLMGAGVGSLSNGDMDGVIAFFIFGSLCLGIGIWTFYNQPLRVGEIPVPTFASYRAAQLAINEISNAHQKNLKSGDKRSIKLNETLDKEENNSAVGREIRALIPEGKPKVQIVAAINVAYSALSECDYRKAHVASRIAFDLEQQNPDAMFAYVVANSALHGGDYSGFFNLAREKRSGWNANWSGAWMLCLLGATEAAETMLLNLTQQKSKNACLWALLGYCQAMNDKPREAINSRRRALELSQGAGDVEDEACHRFVLAQNLTVLGQLSESKPHLEWLAEYAKRETIPGLERLSLELEWLRFQMSMGEDEKALESANNIWANFGEESAQIVRLGQVLHESKEEVFIDFAQLCFEKALETGFYPEAKLALSGIEYERENKPKARTLLIESLDCLRERPTDAAHPMALLSSAIDGIRAIDDDKPKLVKGHEIHLQLERAALELEEGIEKISLLSFAPSLDEAKAMALEIFGAMFPNREIGLHLQTNLAPDDFQPKEPIVSGIYSCKWE